MQDQSQRQGDGAYSAQQLEAPHRRERGSISSDDSFNDNNIAHNKALNRTCSTFSLLSQNPAELVLLKYYLEKVAPLYSILQEDATNAFSTVLLPMAIVDPALLYALLTYASTHIRSCGSASGSGKQIISAAQSLRFEMQAARALSDAINRNTVLDSTIACALVSSTAAVTRGDTTRWHLHLQGAGHLIQHVGIPSLLKTARGAFLVRKFTYHDIMAALSTGRRPQFENWSATGEADLFWATFATAFSADCLMGLAHNILSHVSTLCSLIADAKEGILSADTIHVRSHILAKDLRVQDVMTPCLLLDDRDHEALVHHAEAYRFAALYHLYHFLDSFSVLDDVDICNPRTFYATEMADCVSAIISHVSRIPRNLYCEIGLLFPLFMVGVSAGDQYGIMKYVRDRLEYVASWTSFRGINRALELLEYLWTNGRTDWETVLDEWNWHISLA